MKSHDPSIGEAKKGANKSVNSTSVNCGREIPNNPTWETYVDVSHSFRICVCPPKFEGNQTKTWYILQPLVHDTVALSKRPGIHDAALVHLPRRCQSRTPCHVCGTEKTKQNTNTTNRFWYPAGKSATIHAVTGKCTTWKSQLFKHVSITFIGQAQFSRCLAASTTAQYLRIYQRNHVETLLCPSST